MAVPSYLKGIVLTQFNFGFDLRVAKKILNVSIPLMGSMVGSLLMMLVDQICLARYSNDTLAASGSAIYTATAIIGFFASTAGFSRSCVAQAFGRSGYPAAARQAAIGIVVGAVLALVLLSLAPLTAQIPFLSNRPPAITHLESQFLYWAAYFGGVTTFNISLSSYFNGIGKTRISLVAGLVGQIVDIFMTIGLVFGKFGLPELGMRGSAIGTLIGTLTILVCYLCFIPAEVWGSLKELLITRGMFLWRDFFLRIKKGFAVGLSAGIDNVGNATFIWIVAGLGSIALAANSVNLTVNYIGIIPLIGLGIGCSVLCGNAIGKEDYAQIPRIIFVTLAIELMYAIVIAYFQIFLPQLILNPFGLADKPAAIRTAAVATSKILWTYSLAFGFAMTGGAVLASFGLTRFLFVTRLIVMWCISIPMVYWVTSKHVGNANFLPTCWVIGATFEGVIGALYFWRIYEAVKNRQNDIVLHPATN